MTQTNYDILKEYEEHQEPIPSYREFQQLKKWCEEFNALEVVKENEKLKELLQEYRNRLDTYYSDLLKRIDEVLKEC